MLDLCRLFSCPPDVVERQDARVLRMVAVAREGGYFDQPEGGEWEWPTP